MFEILFSERGLSLDRLKALLDVYEAGSIAGTAPGDVVRHSQFSRQLRQLSSFFGCEVAQREGKVLKLSAEGIRLADVTRMFLRALEDFYRDCRNQKNIFTIGAGDSLVQWLVIPQLARLQGRNQGADYAVCNLRTRDIAERLSDGRCDFGILRKNAAPQGLSSFALGKLSYVLVVPKALVPSKTEPTLKTALSQYSLVTQDTEGEFTAKMRELASNFGLSFRPALTCQSFPQTIAAVRSGRFVAVIPELAVKELPPGFVFKLGKRELAHLSREIVLAWTPRMLEVRPQAKDVLADLQKVLQFS